MLNKEEGKPTANEVIFEFQQRMKSLDIFMSSKTGNNRKNGILPKLDDAIVMSSNIHKWTG